LTAGVDLGELIEFLTDDWRFQPHYLRHEGVRIALASDHAGFPLKQELADWLRQQGHDVSDLGSHGTDSVDYPEFGARLAQAVAGGEAERGIAVCGSGIGISIAVNRNARCRCARVDDPLSAALAREHNDANVLALGARLIGSDMAKACVAAFLGTDFAGGRHQRRVDQLSTLLEESD
jgi:ribose 5-phosphate isomerase B